MRSRRRAMPRHRRRRCAARRGAAPLQRPAAPRRKSRRNRWRHVLRRFQRHQRRRHGGGAQRLHAAGGADRRRRRQRPGFQSAARAVKRRARAVVLIGRDREQIAAALGRLRRAGRARCRHGGGGGICAGGEPQRRCRAAVAGVRELRHVPKLRAPRRSVCRRGEKAGWPVADANSMFYADVKAGRRPRNTTTRWCGAPCCCSRSVW